jgi:hypothetical protein
MIVIQTVLALLIRSLGRVFNMAFGWATIMLFGRVPQERQIFLSIVAFGSIVWLTAVIGVAFPGAATFLLAFVSLPQWVHHIWIRIAMMVAVLVVPPLVGESAIRAMQPDAQPMGWSRIRSALLSGYRVTSGIALALVALMLVAPVLSIRNFMRRWTTRHIPIVIHREDYLEVLDRVQAVLAAGGMPAERSPAGGLLRLPTVIMAFTTGRKIRGLDTEAARLSTGSVEIFLYPFDLVISGHKPHVSRAQSMVAERLPLTRAYMTWSHEGNVLEDRLKHIRTRVDKQVHAGQLPAAGAMAELEKVGRDLALACLPYEEWEVLFRHLLMAERDILLAARSPERPSREAGTARDLIGRQ